MRVLSYGGGLDSFAMLVESIRRGEPPDVVCFVDVSNGSVAQDPTDPGEWPGTYRHVREVAAPLCARHGIKFVWLSSDAYPIRDARSLFAWLDARKQIPVAGPNRICTRIAKVERFERWLADRWPGQAIEVWIGFEAGEEKRAAKDPNAGSADSLRRNRFPLMEWGLCRCRCAALVRAAGFPIPRKSACVFCPYGTRGDWQHFMVDLPKWFAEVERLEAQKPPTRKNGLKLTIMGWDSQRKTGTLLRQYASRPYSRRRVRCAVCGAPRATKATGCDWLDEGREEAA